MEQKKDKKWCFDESECIFPEYYDSDHTKCPVYLMVNGGGSKDGNGVIVEVISLEEM